VRGERRLAIVLSRSVRSRLRRAGRRQVAATLTVTAGGRSATRRVVIRL